MDKIWKCKGAWENFNSILSVFLFFVLLVVVWVSFLILGFYINSGKSVSELFSNNFIFILIALVFIFGSWSYCKFKFFCFQPEKGYIHPEKEHKKANKTCFAMEENTQYFITLHTHFNKSHRDYQAGTNYFIYPTQTDPILSGNIEERIYVNNTYMTLDIPFETNYLDIREDASYLIFRVYKTLTPTEAGNSGKDAQALYHLDVPVRVRVVKPWYKVVVLAFMLSLVKMMLLPFFKADEDFKWTEYQRNFIDCCFNNEKGENVTSIWQIDFSQSNIWDASFCYLDDFLITFLVLVVILTAAHYIFKSLMLGHMRMHH